MVNIVVNKSLQYSKEIVDLYKKLVLKKEYILSKQLLRSGTSIGANVFESQQAESKQDFIHKLSIARKEANESLFWLEILNYSKYLEKPKYEYFFNKTNELIKILTKIIKNNQINKICLINNYKLAIRHSQFAIHKFVATKWKKE